MFLNPETTGNAFKQRKF